MNPLDVLQRFYKPGTKAYDILLRHGELVARKALAIADRVGHLAPDRAFIREAALLHDIGIFLTASPSIGCYGSHPYICHGYLGRQLLEQSGLIEHALVCERHVGVGLSADDVRRLRLPLPVRDMVPVTIEEQIICYADKFFSKNGRNHQENKGSAAVIASLEPYGAEKVQRFKDWGRRFEGWKFDGD